MPKKDFTKSDGAIDKMFSAAKHVNDDNDTKHANVTNITNDTKHTLITNNTEHTIIANHTKHTHVTNKSKHYDDRGPRKERVGLLLDKQLKDDLTNLARATGSKSVNDLIFNVLLDYVEREDMQAKLEGYRKLQ